MHSSTKPFGVSLRFSILPSSNVTNGTADHKVLVGDTEFEVDAQSRQQRGVGLGRKAVAVLSKASVVSRMGRKCW